MLILHSAATSSARIFPLCINRCVFAKDGIGCDFCSAACRSIPSLEGISAECRCRRAGQLAFCSRFCACGGYRAAVGIEGYGISNNRDVLPNSGYGKVIHKPEDEQQIIPNTQEAIISEDLWLRVQELRKNKRRPTGTGRRGLFSGLAYCPECGAKLHFTASKSMTRQQEHFRCANYKSGRGDCQVHFIRDIVLERIVFEAISNLADFVRCYEPVFLYLMATKKIKSQEKANFKNSKPKSKAVSEEYPNLI